jgi:site-specific recombinase XerD
MRMLDAGIDLTTIALWLGHESTESTQPYLLRQPHLSGVVPSLGL